MQDFKRGLFTMLGLCTGLLVFVELNTLFDKAKSTKCKEVKAEEAEVKTE